MRYFSNRPGPTPGPQLPRPNCSVEALREKETVGLKRKIEGLDSSNQHTLLHTVHVAKYCSLLLLFLALKSWVFKRSEGKICLNTAKKS